MINVTFQRAIELPEHGLWLDPRHRQPFAFVSHAHADHIGRHREVVLSPGTSELMRARMGGKRIEHVLEFGETTSVRGLEVMLLPAGHVLGSAQLFVKSEAGTLLYTGDFKLRPGLSCETAEWRHADTLIMETTYGRPGYRFPKTETVLAAIVAFCRESLDAGDIPILFGYSLGKAQEILCAISAAGLRAMVHDAVYDISRIYQRFRPGFPGFAKYDAATRDGHVLIVPPSAARSDLVRGIPNRRTASITGWALDAGARFRFQTDAAFPLSDHADYDDLFRFVNLVNPQLVLTVHGFAEDFARDLRERGVEAWALGRDNQMDLPFPSIERSRPGF